MKNSFRFLLLFLLTFIFSDVKSQMSHPVKWKTLSKKISDCEYELQFIGTIEDGWHVYSLNISGDDGPLPARFDFEKNSEYELVGKPKEGKAIKAHDEVFDMDVAYFEKAVTFKQKIKLKTDKEVEIKGNFEFQACTEVKCVVEQKNPINFKLKGTAACIGQLSSSPNQIMQVASSSSCVVDSNAIYDIINAKNNNKIVTNVGKVDTASKSISPLINVADSDKKSESVNSWWVIFFLGCLAGFSALLTPCVFPMIPMTVTFFTKRSKTKSEGIKNASIYSFSIIAIYTSIGILFTMIFGVDALHAMSTNVWFNLFFFLMLVVFAVSFLGAFEIVLPSRFVNKIDSQSDRGGLIGIFFMAFTLALVSFSCTSAFIGPLLFSAGATGNLAGPFWGMLGFSTALSLPFGLFAAFPGWLNSLPKSGGWLNSVKVVLGFLELALAFKFASNADLVVQAGILTREVFIAIWIVIFGLMGIYLMGWFKLSHDSDLKHISVTRLFFAITSFAFTVYLIPGLWGAPLKIISGFTPPDFYSESPNGFGLSKTISIKDIGDETITNNKKEHCPNDLPCFHDYDEALAYSKKVGKPLMIDFTGWACVNCRKMESQVWPDGEVDKRLRNDVVLVSLYVDDKTALPKNQQTIKKLGNSDFLINTIGTKWAYMQALKYETNSQPQYILVDGDEKMLTTETAHYDPDVKKYIDWLDEGIAEFKKRNAK